MSSCEKFSLIPRPGNIGETPWCIGYIETRRGVTPVGNYAEKCPRDSSLCQYGNSKTAEEMFGRSGKGKNGHNGQNVKSK
ncbi:hypothetical protein C4577_04565 [Candidatus Parcubacteria bacterium]|nr:MAG: hypothetical protein C4577_04565 [Candidatus Parcubacteria bacterium]